MILKISDFKLKKEPSYVRLMGVLKKLSENGYRQASISDLDLIRMHLISLKNKNYETINNSNIEKLIELTEAETKRRLQKLGLP